MSIEPGSFAIILPALAAGIIVSATHVPLGMQVLARGIVFIDLAVAQIAGLGVILADALGWEPQGGAVQVAAFAAAIACALLLHRTERRWPEVQEAIIGVVFVLASSAAILLLAGNPHGGEHLKDLLAGQILWVEPKRLALDALIYAGIFAAWVLLRERLGRFGFYLLFASVVTISVQLVGLYLVFATLVMPALATYYVSRRRHVKAFGIAAAGYAIGLALSALTDLPSGAMIVCAMALAAAVVALASGRRDAPR